MHPDQRARVAKQRRSAVQAMTDERAEALFALYVRMGPTRSLDDLVAAARAVGAKLSLTTVKRYSTRYGWTARLPQVESEALAARDLAAPVVEQMNARQAHIGEAISGLAMDAITAAHKAGRGAVSEIHPRDAARMAEIGVRIERLARGEVTSRAEMIRTVYGRMLVEVWELFASVNDLEDAYERRRRYALGVDALAERYVSADGNPAPLPPVLEDDDQEEDRE
jgi:hypothetical protein